MPIANAENYVVANGVLFRLVKEKKNFDTPMKCLLVIPENFENTVFHMFHDTFFGAHYGPVTFLLVMHVNNKSRKEVRFLTLIQEYLSVTTQ